MQNIVTITRQGQVTIPRAVRKRFGLNGSAKALLHEDGDTITIRPRKNFWQLPGSLKGTVRLSNQQLRRARASFAKEWARQV